MLSVLRLHFNKPVLNGEYIMQSIKPQKWLIASVLLFLSLSAQAKTLVGNVVGILDGDTIEVLNNQQKSYRIRLNQIDAPEKKQPFGQKSKQYLSSLIYGKTVTIEWDKTDRYRRILGTIFYNKQNINIAMVRQGYAWAYTQYVTDNAYIVMQQQAQQRRLGLWIDKSPTPPWEWRRK